MALTPPADIPPAGSEDASWQRLLITLLIGGVLIAAGIAIEQSSKGSSTGGSSDLKAQALPLNCSSDPTTGGMCMATVTVTNPGDVPASVIGNVYGVVDGKFFVGDASYAAFLDATINPGQTEQFTSAFTFAAGGSLSRIVVNSEPSTDGATVDVSVAMP